MKRCRSRLILLGVAACLTACAAAGAPGEKSPPGVSGIRPPPLEPQPEGTPLPPRDPRIAERWPPEIKRLIDNLLTLYPKTPDERPPTVKEVEQKMGITLTERPLQPREARTFSKVFVVSGTRYMHPPSDDQFASGANYTVLRPSRPGNMTQSLQLDISPVRSGFCFDPYELAVYTGSTFVDLDSSPRAASRRSPPAYVWGMFSWSEPGRYLGQGFGISVTLRKDPVTPSITSTACVNEINVAGGGGYQRKKGE